MKSAYEIAMERLKQEHGDTKKLTEAQKAEIAEIERKYEAKIAEQRLSLKGRIATAETPEEFEQLRAELAQTVAALEDKREEEKDAVWNRA